MLKSLNPIKFIHVTEKGEVYLTVLIGCCLIEEKIEKLYGTAKEDKTYCSLGGFQKVTPDNIYSF